LQQVCALQTALIPDDAGKFFRILEHYETQFVEDDFNLNSTFKTKNRLRQTLNASKIERISQ